MDQELQRIQRSNDVTAVGGLADSRRICSCERRAAVILESDSAY